VRIIFLVSLVLAAATGFSSNAHAVNADLTNGWLGVEGGLSVPTYHDTSSRGMWGITAGAKLGTEYGLGAYYLHSSAHEDVDGFSNTPFNYDLYGIQASYHFEGDALGAFFGARLGISKVKRGTIETSPVNYGVFGGYDYFFNRHFSLGGEASVMGVGGGNDQGSHIDSFVMINFLAAAKLWF
jgi:hypothetical protein